MTQYQELLRKEKTLLLNIPAVRKALSAEVKRILNEGKFRSIKRTTLQTILVACDNERTLAEDELELILGIPFSLKTWMELRRNVKIERYPELDAINASVIRLRNTVVEAFVYLVPATRLRYLSRAPVNLIGDLESEGFLGLLQGLETFDLSKGDNLGAHLQGWILCYMQELFSSTEYSRAIRSQAKADKPKEGVSSRNFGKRMLEAQTREKDEVPENILVSLDNAGDPVEIELLDENTSPYHLIERREGAELAARLAAHLAQHPDRFIVQAFYPTTLDSRLIGCPLDPKTAYAALQEHCARRIQLGVARSKAEQAGLAFS